MKKIALCLFLSMGLSAPVFADSSNVADAATADHNAQFQMGLMQQTGHGATQDTAGAVGMYIKAAEAGDTRAQVQLGMMYYSGSGVPRDPALAVAWHRKAAEQGDIIAQTNLATLYLDGDGITHNYPEAMHWFRVAAKRGDARALYALSQMFYKGLGTEKNLDAAVVLSAVAAERGYPDARNFLAVTYASAHSSGQIQAKTAEFLAKVATMGNGGSLDKAMGREYYQVLQGVWNGEKL